MGDSPFMEKELYRMACDLDWSQVKLFVTWLATRGEWLVKARRTREQLAELTASRGD
jgi:hypothetical protein